MKHTKEKWLLALKDPIKPPSCISPSSCDVMFVSPLLNYTLKFTFLLVYRNMTWMLLLSSTMTSESQWDMQGRAVREHLIGWKLNLGLNIYTPNKQRLTVNVRLSLPMTWVSGWSRNWSSLIKKPEVMNKWLGEWEWLSMMSCEIQVCNMSSYNVAKN